MDDAPTGLSLLSIPATMIRRDRHPEPMNPAITPMVRNPSLLVDCVREDINHGDEEDDVLQLLLLSTRTLVTPSSTLLMEALGIDW